MTEPSPETPAPLVAVIIPALNEAGKIGRVLDKFPRDGRFEAIVVDDGSTDGTGDEARAHGAALVIRHDARGGVGAAIRDGWLAGIERRPALPRPPLGRRSARPVGTRHRSGHAARRKADYVQGSRWMAGGHVEGATGGREHGHTDLLGGLQRPRAAPRVRRHERLPHLPCLDPRDPKIDIRQPWLDSYDLEPYVLYKAIRRGYKVVEVPCTVVYHAKEGYTHMRGLRDWWRLFRPAVLLRFGSEAMMAAGALVRRAPDPRDRRGRLRRRGRRQAAGGRRAPR